MGAGKALLIALPFAFLLARGEPTSAPSRAELAGALSREGGHGVATSDIRDLRCRDLPHAAGQECRWQQLENDIWRDRAGHVGVGGEGWRIAR